jgi:hypothetical protein
MGFLKPHLASRDDGHPPPAVLPNPRTPQSSPCRAVVKKKHFFHVNTVLKWCAWARTDERRLRGVCGGVRARKLWSFHS